MQRPRPRLLRRRRRPPLRPSRPRSRERPISAIAGKKRIAPGKTADGSIEDLAVKAPDPKTVEHAVAEATMTPERPNSVLIEHLIGQYTPGTKEIAFTVSGIRMTFTPIADRVELNQLKERAKQFARRAAEKRETDVNYRTDIETLSSSYVLAELSIEPKWTVDELLEMAKRAALLFEAVHGGWMAGQAGAADEEDARKIDFAKERIKADVMWRNRLTIARDVYGKHPLELEGGTYEDIQLLDFVALALIEAGERK